MISIGIYSAPVERNNIKESITNYLNDNNIKYSISTITTTDELFHDFFQQNSKYNIIITYKENKLMYIKINSINYGKNVKQLTSGLLEFPLNNERLDEMMIADNGYNCPYGIFKVNTNKTFRLVPHEDIEYFYSSKGKTKIFLKNDETEEIKKSKKAIKKELTENYFVDCAKGYMVNLYNIKKIDKTNSIILMQSGDTIPINRKKFQHVFREYIKTMCGVKI